MILAYKLVNICGHQTSHMASNQVLSLCMALPNFSQYYMRCRFSSPKFGTARGSESPKFYYGPPGISWLQTREKFRGDQTFPQILSRKLSNFDLSASKLFWF